MTNDTRTERFIARSALRAVTRDLRCFDCGYATVGDAVAVRLTERDKKPVAGFAGLASCGRIWTCPVCNAKVMAKRALEVGAGITWAIGQGMHILFGSLTVRHNASSDLQYLMNLQRDAWRIVVRSRFWLDANATDTIDHRHDGCADDCERKRDIVLSNRPGRVGYIRATEITIGRNGWHPHFHPLIVYRGTEQKAEQFAAKVVRAWVHAVESLGGEARIEGGQQLRRVSGVDVYDALSGYLVKSTYDGAALAFEATWSQGKSGRGRAHSTASHWTLLHDIRNGDYDACERWWQLEEATPGQRMLTWSRGLRAFAGIGDEKTDEAIADEELGSNDDDVCYLTPDGWQAVRGDAALLGAMLSTLEASGWTGLRALLDAYGVEYFVLVN